MDTLDDVIKKRDTWKPMWTLLNVEDEYRGDEVYLECMRMWNALSLIQQRKLYYFVREKKAVGWDIKPDPRDELKATPFPINLNGRPVINSLIKTKKLVRVKLGNGYGILEKYVADLFEIKEQKPLNF